MRNALEWFSDVYACLTPFEQKELVRLILRRAEVSERRIVLELYAVQAQELAAPQSHSRSGILSWLPEQDSNLQPSG